MAVVGATQLEPVNVLGAQQLANNQQLAAFNAANQQAASQRGGLFGLGSAALTAGLPLLFG